jgi:hypothetical protein
MRLGKFSNKWEQEDEINHEDPKPEPKLEEMERGNIENDINEREVDITKKPEEMEFETIVLEPKPQEMETETIANEKEEERV